MNIQIISKIISTLLGKDTDPTEIAKPIFLRRRYWALGIFICSAYAYQHYGLVLGDDIQTIILNNLQVIYADIKSLISAIGSIYGIYLGLKGQIGQQKKLVVKAEVAQHEADMAKAECAGMQAADKIATGQASTQASAPGPVTPPAEPSIDTSMEGLQ